MPGSPCTTMPCSQPSAASACAMGSTHCARVHADQLAPRAGRVGQRPEQVEDRAHAQRAPHGPRVAHGGVVGGRVQVAEAVALDHLRGLLGREVDRHAERLEHVGRARARRGRAVTVLGDGAAAGGRDEGRRRGDVERARAVAAGAGGVDQVVARGRHGDDVRAHRARRADQLVDGLALGRAARPAGPRSGPGRPRRASRARSPPRCRRRSARRPRAGGRSSRGSCARSPCAGSCARSRRPRA